MHLPFMNFKRAGLCCLLLFVTIVSYAQHKSFKVIGFYTAKADPAHISFVHEANAWLAQMSKKHHFTYDSTNNWKKLDTNFLKAYQVILFLDTRPEEPDQRKAFEYYMKHGGAWIGFHFSAFALTPSAIPQNWDWYHNDFLGSGQYASNTWRPTAAVLRVESDHATTKALPKTFRSSPNEWYRWQHDLRRKTNIKILLAIDSTSFPLGTGPKPNEIWQSGYYPVAWTNTKYKMVYINMGHNDMDYEHKYDTTNRALSHTFDNAAEDQFVLNALLWLSH